MSRPSPPADRPSQGARPKLGVARDYSSQQSNPYSDVDNEEEEDKDVDGEEDDDDDDDGHKAWERLDSALSLGRRRPQLLRPVGARPAGTGEGRSEGHRRAPSNRLQSRSHRAKVRPHKGSTATDWPKEVFQKKRILLQGTKKKGCTATLHFKHVELYPDFKADIPQPCGRNKKERLKSDKARQLNEALQAKQAVSTECRVYVAVADLDSHCNHGFDEIEAFSQGVNKDIAERTEMLVREGITSVPDVKKCLLYYVRDVLFSGKEKPDTSSRAFYPTNRDVSNHIQAVLRKDRFSTIDQENAGDLVKKISSEQPDSFVLYRPYRARSCVTSTESENVEEVVASECEETLLFCFQSKFMNTMLLKYGSAVVCLDATHKTSDYALPLFLLVVKTPSGYAAAGTFIVQFETSFCIAEALNIFKQWGNNFSPQYWMVDYSNAEISAIRQVFVNSRVTICDFHRIQAWQRWLRRKENNISHPEHALQLMKRLGSALNEGEFEKALKDLVSSEYWNNEKFRSYFETVWLGVKELWVMFHRLEFDVVLTTNNGIEAQNRVLKAHYVKSASGKRSLTSLIAAVVCGYLPDNEKKFHESTMRQSSLYRQYKDAVPAFLHNRPHSFIRHMLRRLVNAEEYTRSDIRELPTEGAFAVQSERDDDEAHTVEFCKPLCTCPDFAKHKYPCKHFCAVFKHISGWSFASLPDSYRNRPEITLGSCPPSDTSSDVLDLVELPVFEAPQQALHSEREALGNPAASVLRKAIAEEWEKCSSLLHYCHDVDALLDTKKMVESAFRRLAECVPHSSGLQIRGSPTKGCSSLKPLPKRKRL
ncbi:uncharacterized protein LOC144139664 [Haemaphysalis longicornis]